MWDNIMGGTCVGFFKTYILNEGKNELIQTFCPKISMAWVVALWVKYIDYKKNFP